MARKKKHPEHVNHERWLVSYADFITLLFAFFVVMFAVSQVDSKKVGRFTQSFNEALEWQVIQQPGTSSPGGDGVIPELSGKAKETRKTPDYPAEKDAIRRGLAQRLGKVPVLAGLHVLEVRLERGLNAGQQVLELRVLGTRDQLVAEHVDHGLVIGDLVVEVGLVEL